MAETAGAVSVPEISLEALREQVAVGSRVLAEAGHDDLIWGHVSGRDPAGRGIWLKASGGLGMDAVGVSDVILVSRDGEVLEGAGPRHIEFPIHSEVLATRPDAGAVVHTHARHATALGASGQPLLPFSHAASLFVPPELPRFTETGDLIRTAALGRAVARKLGESDALLLVNHGLVTVGRGVADAVARAVVLEQACEMQLLVRGYGGSPTCSDPEESLAKREHIYSPRALQQVFDYLVRGLSR